MKDVHVCGGLYMKYKQGVGDKVEGMDCSARGLIFPIVVFSEALLIQMWTSESGSPGLKSGQLHQTFRLQAMSSIL